jgi:hypothetical protein
MTCRWSSTVSEDLPSCPLVKGRSGGEVAKREGWRHGCHFRPGGLAFFVYMFQRCCSRLGTNKRRVGWRCLAWSIFNRFFQVRDQSARSTLRTKGYQVVRDVVWHLLNLWDECFICLNVSRAMLSAHNTSLIVIFFALWHQSVQKQQTCCQSSLTSGLVHG